MRNYIFTTLFLGSCLFCQAAEQQARQAKPAYDSSKDVGLQAPANTDILFDGTQQSIDKNWEMWPQQDMPITWSLVDNPNGEGKLLMTNGGKKWGTHDLVTKKKYTDFEGHVEFLMMGKRGDGIAEGYSNSGVYMQNRYELQIESPKGEDVLDPYNWEIGKHGIGAFCLDRVPDYNVWRPNGEWHAFHFIFRAARYKGDKLVEKARATVWWNGVKIHDNASLKRVDPRAGIPLGPAPGGIKLQEHGKDVRFRNIWIVDKGGSSVQEAQ
jgi:hypothetical protein